jgi:vibriolysin
MFISVYLEHVVGYLKLDLNEKINQVFIDRKREIQAQTSPQRIVELLLDDNNGLDSIDNGKTIENTKIIRFQETFKGVPIHNAYVTEEVDSDTGEWTGQVSGNWYDRLEEDITSVVPQLSEDQVLYIAMSSEGLQDMSEVPDSKITLTIVPMRDTAVLCYDVTLTIISPGNMKRPGFFIDANSGQILRKMQRLQNSVINAVGGNVKSKINYGADFPPLEVTKGSKGKRCRLKSKYVRVYDLQSATELPKGSRPFKFRCEDGLHDESNGGFSPMSDAFYMSQRVFEMFEEWADTPVVPDPPIDIWVHYGELKFTAMYNGINIVFGDGDKNFFPLTTYDVVGHEFAHIFTESHSNLEYENQSGGINEAYSDLAGEAFELYATGTYDLHVGSKADKNDNEGIRDLCNQNKDGESIVHVKDYHDKMEVHLSSGIFNRVSCLLMKEPTIGLKVAFQIYTHANRFYWCPNSNFSEAACGILKAAYDLGHDTEIIRDALQGVGITGCGLESYVRKIYGKTHMKSLSANESETIVFGFLGRLSLSQKIRVFTEGGSGDVDVYVNSELKLDMALTKHRSTFEGNFEIVQVPYSECLANICFIHLVPKDKGFKGVSLQIDIV